MDVTLENLMFRFSHLSETIFDLVNNQSLVNCRFVSRDLNVYLSQQKFHQIRIIKETLVKFQELEQPWINVFKTANTTTIMELGCAVDQFYAYSYGNISYKGITPLHVAAATGNVLLFDMILQHAQDKDPINDDGNRPIMFAVSKNDIEMTRAIIKKIEDKNPVGNDGLTLLHVAAIYGYFEMFKMIWKEAKDKNPKCKVGWTPLHSAAYYGHLNICEMIIDSGEEKNLEDLQRRTPLTLAFKNEQVDVCMLLLTKFENKNPIIDDSTGNNNGNTALHEAAKKGYLEMCELILKNVEDKNPQNTIGKTPLTLASENDHINVCILICHYLKKNEKTWKNMWGWFL